MCNSYLPGKFVSLERRRIAGSCLWTAMPGFIQSQQLNHLWKLQFSREQSWGIFCYRRRLMQM